MSFGEDEEILQDFLVEAGEILELLSEQLVQLEQTPDNVDLLNAIFRGFHTVKGGAGFLQLDALVDCCHITENLFDILRNGKRGVTPELMDVVLQALDAINGMFEQVQARELPTPADPGIIQRLADLVACNDLAGAAPAAKKSAPPPAEEDDLDALFESARSGANDNSQDDISNDDLDAFLDVLGDDAKSAAPKTGAAGHSSAGHHGSAGENSTDDITEAEFEALLDEIHGKGQTGFSAAPSVASKKSAPNSNAPSTTAPRQAPLADAFSAPKAGSTGDAITEDEFENLLDQLHGVGGAPGVGTSGGGAAKAPSPVKPPAAKAPVPPAPSGGKAKTTAGEEIITDDEFDALLDQLHGEGSSPAPAAKAPKPAGLSRSPRAAHAAPEPDLDADPLADFMPVESLTGTGSRSDHSSRESFAAAASVAGEDRGESRGGAAKSAPREGPVSVAGETTVRVDTQRLDDIMNMVGELVLVRNRLVRLGSNSGDEEMSKAVSNLDVVTADLQTSVMKTRMQPIKKVFGRFPRVVRDLARNLKKEINLELEGEETDLDKNLVEALADPLVHLVRNSVDHGIELPAVREAAGKPRVGRVILAAEQEGDHILLSITDDGAGMDAVKLRTIAVEKGLLDRDIAERLSDSEAFDLIFMPGFSSKTEISDISGRGVGMDVVKTKITQLNGSIEIRSKLGEGSRIAIKVPLTLAIMPTLMVMLGDQTFALPLVSVNEIFHMDLSQTNVVDGQEVVIVREKALPLFHLKRWLVRGTKSDHKSPGSAHVVIVSVGTQRVGFVVDQLIGQEEVVIKPLGKMLHGTPGMAGATITGDGRIALILDVPSMLKRYAG